jgi:hypothetical protein
MTFLLLGRRLSPVQEATPVPAARGRQSHQEQKWPADVLRRPRRPAGQLVVGGMFTQVVEDEPGPDGGYDIIADLVRDAFRPGFAARGRVREPGLDAPEHQGRVHVRDDRKPAGPQDAPRLAEHARQVADVVQHQPTDDAVEMPVRERQRVVKVVAQKRDSGRAWFGARLVEHLNGEVDRGDGGTRGRERQAVTTGAAPEVEQAQPADVTEQASDERLLEGHERVGVGVVNRRPAVVTFPRRQQVDGSRLTGHDV